MSYYNPLPSHQYLCVWHISCVYTHADGGHAVVSCNVKNYNNDTKRKNTEKPDVKILRTIID